MMLYFQHPHSEQKTNVAALRVIEFLTCCLVCSLLVLSPGTPLTHSINQMKGGNFHHNPLK